MNLQDFIAVWQAQPFRAFRLHAAGSIVTVAYPWGAALSPTMRVFIIADNGHAVGFALDEIERCEAFGEADAVADIINRIPPEILARDAQNMAAALKSDESSESGKVAAKSFDSGMVKLLGSDSPQGIYFVHAAVTTREGEPIFTTAGTRWNVHGVEQFEHGTSLYLHHLDDPTVEQRAIIWPPDSGTLESFAEAKPLPALAEELRRRDQRLTENPVEAAEPPASYYRNILRAYPSTAFDPRAEEFGEAPDHRDFDRFEIHLVPRRLADGTTVNNPCLVDVPAEKFLFDLTETNWNATFTRGLDMIELTLNYASDGAAVLKLTIDPYRLSVYVDEHAPDLPLGLIEAELRNYSLYESWDLMVGALRTGPDRFEQPNVTLPLTQGFTAELWAGEARFPLPFLQPRIVTPAGKTLLDFRATPWAALVVVDKKNPMVTLRLWSHERTERCAEPGFDLQLNLVTHRVTCPGLAGSTTLGMIQAMIRHVRGVKWLREDLSKWFAKGQSLPLHLQLHYSGWDSSEERSSMRVR